jgi:hypothetical protein
MIEHQRNLLRVTLNYASIHGLFRTPDVSPFSEDYQVYSTTAGIEFIVNEMRANSSLKRVEVTIVLPADQITPDLETQTCEAVRRYCRARIHAVGQDQRILHTRILRSVALAVIALFLSVGIGYPMSIEEDFAISLIGNILYFFGWVAIWYPMDAIVFGRRDLSMDANSYQRAIEMQLSIRSAL